MNDYVILVGLAHDANPGDAVSKQARLVELYKLIFSLGPAWHGNQGSILLKSDLSHEEVVNTLSPLIGESDLLGVLSLTPKSLTTIGWNADAEGLESLYPDAVTLAASPAESTREVD